MRTSAVGAGGECRAAVGSATHPRVSYATSQADRSTSSTLRSDHRGEGVRRARGRTRWWVRRWGSGQGGRGRSRVCKGWGLSCSEIAPRSSRSG